jgi:hypothetical protein
MMSMSEFIQLQKSCLASGQPPAGNLLSRYEILPRYATLDLGRGVPMRTRLYRLGRNLLISLGVSKPSNKNGEWLASLKHAPVSPDAKIILIWGLGEVADRQGLGPNLSVLDSQSKLQTLQHACLNLKDRFARPDVVSPSSSCSQFIPVLITDQADFAFYSRLGWLVEYLPDLPGSGESYCDRKLAYLAWRYQTAVVLPLSAGLMEI